MDAGPRFSIDTMDAMSSGWLDFEGVNAAYALELYERFQRDPKSVDPETRAFFEQHPPSTPAPQHLGALEPCDPSVIVGAVNLAQSIRLYGHLAAQIDPLGSRPVGDPTLVPSTHGVTEADLRRLPASLIGGPVAEGADTVWDVVERLRQIYCSTTGFDVAHIFVAEERQWLRDAIETGRFRAPADPIDPVALLERLTQVEAFERFLHRTFPGKTRFSIEGLDTLVPLLDEVIGEAAGAGMRRTFIAMAHRGRLNVMAHVLGKPYRADPGGVQGPRHPCPRDRRGDVERRRQVPPRCVAGAGGRRSGRDGDLDAAESESSGGDRPGARRHGPGGRHRRGAAGAAGLRSRSGPADSDPRRCGVPGAGRRGRDAESPSAARLHDGRHDSYHRQQSDRLHDRAGGRREHALCERARPRVQDPDLPRQRRRP